VRKTWTDSSAHEALKVFICDGKIIKFNGKATLCQCSAADYLVSNHGYIISADFTRKEG